MTHLQLFILYSCFYIHFDFPIVIYVFNMYNTFDSAGNQWNLSLLFGRVLVQSYSRFIQSTGKRKSEFSLRQCDFVEIFSAYSK